MSTSSPRPARRSCRSNGWARCSPSQGATQPEIATAITNLWVDYQLLGDAAAHNDSLTDPKIVDEALWSIISQERTSKWHEQHAKTYAAWTRRTSPNATRRVRCSRRATFSSSCRRVRARRRDSIRKKAEAVRRQVTDELRRPGPQVHAGAELGGARRQPRSLPEGRDGAAVRASGARAQAGRDLAGRQDAVRLPHHSPVDVPRSRG